MSSAIELVEAALRIDRSQPFPTQRTATRVQALEAAVRALAALIDDLERERVNAAK